MLGWQHTYRREVPARRRALPVRRVPHTHRCGSEAGKTPTSRAHEAGAEMHRSRGLFGILTWQQNNSQGRILFRDDCVSAGAIRRPALRYATWIAGRPADTPTMGIRTRGLDIGINAKR